MSEKFFDALENSGKDNKNSIAFRWCDVVPKLVKVNLNENDNLWRYADRLYDIMRVSSTELSPIHPIIYTSADYSKRVTNELLRHHFEHMVNLGINYYTGLYDFYEKVLIKVQQLYIDNKSNESNLYIGNATLQIFNYLYNIIYHSATGTIGSFLDYSILDNPDVVNYDYQHAYDEFSKKCDELSESGIYHEWLLCVKEYMCQSSEYLTERRKSLIREEYIIWYEFYEMLMEAVNILIEYEESCKKEQKQIKKRKPRTSKKKKEGIKDGE